MFKIKWQSPGNIAIYVPVVQGVAQVTLRGETHAVKGVVCLSRRASPIAVARVGLPGELRRIRLRGRLAIVIFRDGRAELRKEEGARRAYRNRPCGEPIGAAFTAADIGGIEAIPSGTRWSPAPA